MAHIMIREQRKLQALIKGSPRIITKTNKTLKEEERNQKIMNENKRDKGITLIALVVTIIVLMILSGVTLRVLSGDDGIIEEAKLASNLYESASDEERTKIDTTKNKLIEIRESRQNGNDGGSEQGGSDQGNSGQGSSGESGITIKENNGTVIDLGNIANYYGREVTYNGETYQLFYVDTEGKYSNEEPRIWLQYQGYVSEVKLSDHFETTGLADTSSIVYQINPGWKELIGNELLGKTDAQLSVAKYNNYRGVAYLCNPDNWNDDYLEDGHEAKGAFAIGGVSAEMWCDSYNLARNKISTEADFFSAKAYSNGAKGYRFKPGYIYASTNPEGYAYSTNYADYSITTRYGTMYRISGNNYPWLASPSSYGTDYVCRMYCTNGRLSYSNSTDAGGVRPAVSLPASIQIKLNVLTEID